MTHTAVFTADRDTDGNVRVKERGVEIGQIFLPNTSTNEGWRQIAQGLLDGKIKDLPLQVSQTIKWLMTALDAKLFIEGTTEGSEPEVNLRLWVSSSNQLHLTSITVLPTWMVSPRRS